MEGIRSAIARFVSAGMKAKHLHEQYLHNDLNVDPPFEIWGEILSGLYDLIGEETETFEESVTHLAMTAPLLSEERRVKMLYSRYLKIHPEQPKPITFETIDVQKMYRHNGGYMYETPEGDWS